MIKNRKELKLFLKTERQLYGKNKACYVCRLFSLTEEGIIWKFQRRLRIWEYHLNKKHKLITTLWHFLTTKLGNKYGLHLRPNNFDVGLHILHLGPILVNGESRVGKNCCIHINTALVATGGISDSPHIGDNCRIGVGAILIGGIKLGNDVVVGAGAVVTKSFEEDHITLAGVPAKIISRKAIM